MKTKLIILALVLGIALLAPLTGATILGIDTQYGTITNATEYTDYYHIEYSANQSALLNMYCKDSMNYYVNVWGASVMQAGTGQYDVLKTDLLGNTQDICKVQLESDEWWK